MEMTPTLILNLALLIVPPVALVLVFRQWLARHIRWTVALTALCDVLLFWDELFYYIEAPKTESGFRQVPMSAAAYEAFERVLKKRRDGRCIEVDDYKDFLFLNRDGLPKTAVNYDAMFKCLAKKYNKCHKEPLPDVMTPHTMRHTFCTRMANAGMNPKALQYIMGHANIVMTLNYYAHATFHSAQEEMERLQAKAKTTAEAKPEPVAESAEETKAA